MTRIFRDAVVDLTGVVNPDESVVAKAANFLADQANDYVQQQLDKQQDDAPNTPDGAVVVAPDGTPEIAADGNWYQQNSNGWARVRDGEPADQNSSDSLTTALQQYQNSTAGANTNLTNLQAAEASGDPDKIDNAVTQAQSFGASLTATSVDAGAAMNLFQEESRAQDLSSTLRLQQATTQMDALWDQTQKDLRLHTELYPQMAIPVDNQSGQTVVPELDELHTVSQMEKIIESNPVLAQEAAWELGMGRQQKC